MGVCTYWDYFSYMPSGKCFKLSWWEEYYVQHLWAGAMRDLWLNLAIYLPAQNMLQRLVFKRPAVSAMTKSHLEAASPWKCTFCKESISVLLSWPATAVIVCTKPAKTRKFLVLPACVSPALSMLKVQLWNVSMACAGTTLQSSWRGTVLDNIRAYLT